MISVGQLKPGLRQYMQIVLRVPRWHQGRDPRIPAVGLGSLHTLKGPDHQLSDRLVGPLAKGGLAFLSRVRVRQKFIGSYKIISKIDVSNSYYSK